VTGALLSSSVEFGIDGRDVKLASACLAGGAQVRFVFQLARRHRGQTTCTHRIGLLEHSAPGAELRATNDRLRLLRSTHDSLIAFAVVTLNTWFEVEIWLMPLKAFSGTCQIISSAQLVP
jgi:hypothetical protein